MILDVHVTTRCNLRCRHCYLKDLKERRDMDLDQFADLLIDASLHNVRTFIISGGEPLYHKNFEEIYHAYKLYYPSLAMATNGTLISDYIDLFSSEDKGIQISLDGDKEFHDWLRGEGTYDAVIHGIEELRERGITPSIAYTVARENIHCTDHIIDLCKRYNIRYVNVNMYMPLSNSELTPLTLKQFFEVREKFRTAGIRISEPCYLKRCIAGVGVLSILPDGTIYPCSRHQVKIGDIKKNNLNVSFENDGNQFKTCMGFVKHNLPPKLKMLEKIIEKRLETIKQFVKETGRKVIVEYKGEMSGDLGLYYLDKAEIEHTVLACLLPCMSEKLREYIIKEAEKRDAIIIDLTNEKCIDNYTNNACRKILNYYPKNAVVIVTCFYTPETSILEEWARMRLYKIQWLDGMPYLPDYVLGDEALSLYLFYGLDGRLLQKLYYYKFPEKPTGYFRILLCDFALKNKDADTTRLYSTSALLSIGKRLDNVARVKIEDLVV